jgi:hypothetical protein
MNLKTFAKTFIRDYDAKIAAINAQTDGMEETVFSYFLLILDNFESAIQAYTDQVCHAQKDEIKSVFGERFTRVFGDNPVGELRLCRGDLNAYIDSSAQPTITPDKL